MEHSENHLTWHVVIRSISGPYEPALSGHIVRTVCRAPDELF